MANVVPWSAVGVQLIDAYQQGHHSIEIPQDPLVPVRFQLLSGFDNVRHKDMATSMPKVGLESTQNWPSVRPQVVPKSKPKGQFGAHEPTENFSILMLSVRDRRRSCAVGAQIADTLARQRI